MVRASLAARAPRRNAEGTPHRVLSKHGSDLVLVRNEEAAGFRFCHPDHSRRSLTCGNTVACARRPVSMALIVWRETPRSAARAPCDRPVAVRRLRTSLFMVTSMLVTMEGCQVNLSFLGPLCQIASAMTSLSSDVRFT